MPALLQALLYELSTHLLRSSIDAVNCSMKYAFGAVEATLKENNYCERYRTFFVLQSFLINPPF